MSDQIVPIGKAAEILNVPASWLLAEAKAGRIPCLWVGKRRLRVNPEAVGRVLAERAAKGGKP